MSDVAKRGSMPVFATVVLEAVVSHGRRGAHFLFEVLQDACEANMERAQMRLAPVRPRSWREIQMSIRQSELRVDDFKQRPDHVDNCAAELVPLQMSTWQSDVRFDDFKQPIDHVDNCATELVPRCCGENTLWFWQQDTTLPDILPVIVAGRRPASLSSGEPLWVSSVSPHAHVGNELCIPSVMC